MVQSRQTSSSSHEPRGVPQRSHTGPAMKGRRDQLAAPSAPGAWTRSPVIGAEGGQITSSAAASDRRAAEIMQDS